MRRYTRVPTVFALTTMMALSTAAWAGAKGGSGVTLTTSGDNGTASGSMGAVRSSADTVQFIGCVVSGSGTHEWVSCSARNASNVAVSCSSADPAIVHAAQTMTADAHLSFSWNGSGACTALHVRTDSRYTPKQP